jgi:hypothetical protein
MRVVIATATGMIGAIILVLFLSFLLSWPAYVLWNGCLVGAVDGVREITWLQAWGISALIGLLFNRSYERSQ